MSVVDTTAASEAGLGPQSPMITNKDIWAQFKIDIAGKEVQTAETYSHSWIANQFGHVCLGIILGALLGVLLGTGASVIFPWLRLPVAWHIPFPWDNVIGSALAAIGIAWWELRAYRMEVKEATGHQFAVDRRLLRDNAVVAAAYMMLGVLIALIYRYFAFTAGNWLSVPTVVWGAGCFVLLVAIGVRLAVPWLRQKITWQKAGLPYLFRLADAQPTKEQADAKDLQKVINENPPPEGDSKQIVIGGPIGSGRTQYAASIGTEFAFRNATVRYLSFATLLEFAARSGERRFADDRGPENILYWPWSTAQVVVIDDIGPVLSASGQAQNLHLQLFSLILDQQLAAVRGVLARCHTVWVIGDGRRAGQVGDDDEALEQFAHVIKAFCGGSQTLAVELPAAAEGAREENLKLPRARRIRSV